MCVILPKADVRDNCFLACILSETYTNSFSYKLFAKLELFLKLSSLDANSPARSFSSFFSHWYDWSAGTFSGMLHPKCKVSVRCYDQCKLVSH